MSALFEFIVSNGHAGGFHKRWQSGKPIIETLNVGRRAVLSR
jgi:hypothetical protein